MSKRIKLKFLNDNIAELTLNHENSANVLDTLFFKELNDSLDKIDKQSIKTIVFTTVKKDFALGADIQELYQIQQETEVKKKVETALKTFSRFTQKKYTTISFLEGFALGGGLELALACDIRLASTNGVKLGLPEVKLGIIPGFGGTARMLSIVGAYQAIDLITSGKIIDGKKAYKIGLVDDFFVPTYFEKDKVKIITNILKNIPNIRKKSEKKNHGTINKLFYLPIINRFIHYGIKKLILKKTNGHYPAPLTALKVIKNQTSISVEKGIKLETKHFIKLFNTPTSKNLIHLFLTDQKVKKLYKTTPFNVQDLAVIGAGNMGNGITFLGIFFNIFTTLKDIKLSFLENGVSNIEKTIQKKLKKRKITPREYQVKKNLLNPTLSYSNFKRQDIVIEAVVEKIEIKNDIFKELEKRLDDNAIIATNTSALSINKMAHDLNHPERFIGLHFFNPAPIMPLVEVIPSDKTSKETIEKCLDFLLKIKKKPILVKDSPGFLINRILMPYINEAGHLISEGVDPKRIDRILKKWGMPMGPLELLDTVGIDIGYEVIQTLKEVHPYEEAEILNILKNKNQLGKKNGIGIYQYKLKQNPVNPVIKIKKNNRISNEDIWKRCLFMMINEAYKCLDEKIIEHEEVLDIATIYGIGFPPFLGGIIKFSKDHGLNNITTDLNHFKQIHERFTPANLLIKQ